MNEIILNKTPLSTSNNFRINNITLENVEFKKSYDEFYNLNIVNESKSKIKIEKNENINLSFKYGIHDSLKNITTKNSYKIDISSKTSKSIYFTYIFDEKNVELADNILINANENTNCTVILKYLNSSEKKSNECFHNLNLNVISGKNSTLNIVILNFMNENSRSFVNIENLLQESSKLNYVFVDFGGKTSLTNYYSSVLGEKAENNVNSIYLGNKNQIFDLNYIIHLIGKASKSKIDVQGALNKNSKKHFKGTLDFKRGCKKAVGDENDSCVLLSNNARSLSLPMLLCSEEDVNGNHSSSSGKIDKKTLFYLMSRGMSKKDAQKLVVMAKFNNIINNIKDEKIKKEIETLIEKKIN